MDVHKHKLKRIENDEVRHTWKDGDQFHRHFAFFACEKCGKHFYMRKEDLEKHLSGENTKPLEERGMMFSQNKEGKWLLTYTIIS